ncbi:Hsp20/alpha crystallin family protein [Weeksellaceae bacterium A-14]|uniref:Hsp20/alpha crystallin family protein n=1 Tax=Daejeonia sp. YH14 TaxID=3439042 RepID=UPI0031E4A999
MTTLIKKTQPVPVFANFFDDIFAKDLFNWNDKNFAEFGNTLPSVNIKESDKDYAIEMAVPGMKKDSFKISLDKNMLTISAENKSENEEKDENGKYTRREFNYQTFSRSFTLPSESVDADSISANYEDGILKIEVPKKVKEEQQVKTIEVQ